MKPFQSTLLALMLLPASNLAHAAGENFPRLECRSVGWVNVGRGNQPKCDITCDCYKGRQRLSLGKIDLFTTNQHVLLNYVTPQEVNEMQERGPGRFENANLRCDVPEGRFAIQIEAKLMKVANEQIELDKCQRLIGTPSGGPQAKPNRRN